MYVHYANMLTARHYPSAVYVTIYFHGQCVCLSYAGVLSKQLGLKTSSRKQSHFREQRRSIVDTATFKMSKQ